MTVEEKRTCIENHCKSMTACSDCELISELNCFDDASDSEIENNYNLLFGTEKGKEEEKDKVDHPSHYQGKNECIDVMLAMFGVEAVKGFCKCNAYKYRFRAGQKEGNSAEQDIEKAEWYETYLMGLEKNNG